MFRRLPWGGAILEGMLAHDVLGFQTLRDRRNFVGCVRDFMPEVGIRISRRYTRLRVAQRTVHVGHFPISIDFEEFNNGAQSAEVAHAASQLREGYLARQLILGLDRLDYTKGIPERFLALERALEKYPDLRGNVSLIQVVIPSRTHVPDYRNLKSEIDELAGRVNGRFSRDGWVPIHYYYRALSRIDLLAHYRGCEIAFITPLRDGMNLVAKEYCASTVDGNGVLILSKFAGAADQLCPGAVCVNPFDREKTADAIHDAFVMDPRERKRRMKTLRAEIRRNNVHRWLGWITALIDEEQSTSEGRATEGMVSHARGIDA
jgi:trehalose 6-phosphate synthase